MRSWTLALLVLFTVACRQGAGERCNPLQYSENGIQGNCEDGLACIYPTAPNCGVAYCCRLTPGGKDVDPNPSCRPDPSLFSVCGIDMDGPLADAGASD
jgi:hypothetical protein